MALHRYHSKHTSIPKLAQKAQKRPLGVPESRFPRKEIRLQVLALDNIMARSATKYSTTGTPPRLDVRQPNISTHHGMREGDILPLENLQGFAFMFHSPETTRACRQDIGRPSPRQNIYTSHRGARWSWVRWVYALLTEHPPLHAVAESKRLRSRQGNVARRVHAGGTP